jgi:hypothetical protein
MSEVGIFMMGLVALGWGSGCSSETGRNEPTVAFPAVPEQPEPPCDDTPPVDYQPLPANDCGGSPYGVWSYKQMDASRVHLPAVPECPLTVQPPANPRFVLQLLEGGTGNLTVSGLEIKGRGEYSCLHYVTAQYHCTKAGCGLVDCIVPPRDPLPTSTLTWTTESPGTLVLRTTQGTFSLRFCVDGDIMTVDFDVGWEMQLERAPQ